MARQEYAHKESKILPRSFEETRRAVENAEIRARAIGRRENSKFLLYQSNREFADALHREADQIYQECDYETALILYHRAASIYPRDAKHIAAAEKAVSTINFWSNPPDSFVKRLSKMTNEEDAGSKLCPESAAMKASDLLRKSPDPAAMISQALKYLDNHKSLWRVKPRVNASITSSKRSKTALVEKLRRLADVSLKSLKTNFRVGNIEAVMRISHELLVLSSKLEDSSHYQVTAYRYISLSHVSSGRHDRAVNSARKMMCIAKASNDVNFISRSLVTLGKVHLCFGHLNAAARAWTSQLTDLPKMTLRAWLHHEIGRCYFQAGEYLKALDMASYCLKATQQAASKKWLLYGNLLSGQTFLKLGRLPEALESLNVAANIAKERADAKTSLYTEKLINYVQRAILGTVSNGVRQLEKSSFVSTARDRNSDEKSMTLVLRDHTCPSNLQKFRNDIKSVTMKESARFYLSEGFWSAHPDFKETSQRYLEANDASTEREFPSRNARLKPKECLEQLARGYSSLTNLRVESSPSFLDGDQKAGNSLACKTRLCSTTLSGMKIAFYTEADSVHGLFKSTSSYGKLSSRSREMGNTYRINN